MKNPIRIAITFASLALLSPWNSAVMRPDDPATIHWKPVAGSKLKLRFTNRHGREGGKKMTVVWLDTMTLTKVQGGKVWAQNSNGDVKVATDDGEGDVNVQVGDFDLQYTLRGDVIAGADDTDGFGLLFSVFGGFRFPNRPLKEGEDWKTKVDSPDGRQHGEVRVTFKGTEELNGTKCFKLDYDFFTSGDGLASNGTIWLAAETGNLVKRVATLKNADFGGGPETMTQEVEAVG